MTNHFEDEIRSIVVGMDNQESQEPRQTWQEQQTPQDEVQDIYVLIVREHEEVEEDQSNIVESAPAPATFDVTPVTTQLQNISFLPAYAICSLFLFLITASITFQMYEALNPPIATITIIPKSQQVTLNGTLQIGRLLNPITISQSQTVPTTGHGHQDARAATGYITLYNGQMNSVFVSAGTVFTGSDGEQIITDQDASIPAANLPQVGQVTVSAHAISPGLRGNIAAYDINQGCCATAIKAVNTNLFYGGQDKLDFSTVSKQDINKISTILKSSLALSIQGALQGHAKPNEQLQILPCNPIVTSDHQPGDKAIQVQVTVSETCSAVAYNRGELETKATQLLTSQALKKLGSGYSLFGNIQVSVKQASVIRASHPPVFLSFEAHGTWIYGISHTAQEYIKKLIGGKTKQQALQMLAAMPGVERGSIVWDAKTKLPKNSRYIHMVILIHSV